MLVELQGGLEGLGEPGDVGSPAPPGEAGVLGGVIRVLPRAFGARLHDHGRHRRLLALVLLRFGPGGCGPG